MNNFVENEEEKMLKVGEVAKWFLSIESMNNLKLQKLCYYAQAWYLAVSNKRLMDTRFEAWVHGPVSPELYQQYKKWGWYDIGKYYGQLNISQHIQEFLKIIYNMYGGFTGDELEELTHNEKPWNEARQDLDKNVYSQNEIDENTMKEYYRGLLEQ